MKYLFRRSSLSLSLVHSIAYITYQDYSTTTTANHRRYHYYALCAARLSAPTGRRPDELPKRRERERDGLREINKGNILAAGEERERERDPSFSSLMAGVSV
jgi:hypothetical protein